MNDQNRCGTCKWWGDGEYITLIPSQRPSGWGYCRLADRDDGIDEDHDEDAYDPSMMQVYCSDEIVGASLLTSPEWGCVQWQEK